MTSGLGRQGSGRSSSRVPGPGREGRLGWVGGAVRGQEASRLKGSVDGLVRPGQPSPLQEKLESPVDVHAVSHPGHPQIDVVLLGQGGKVGAIDLVVQEPGPVFGQAQPL